jgi:hypothetical protein
MLVAAGVCSVAVHFLAAAARQHYALSWVSATVTPAAVRPLVNIAASSRRGKASTARTPITHHRG